MIFPSLATIHAPACVSSTGTDLRDAGRRRETGSCVAFWPVLLQDDGPAKNKIDETRSQVLADNFMPVA
jgi:hypothetical protein